MKNKFKPHRYSDLESFERLLLLIATLVKYPGVGYRDRNLFDITETHHNALEEVKFYLQKLADQLGIDLPKDYPAIATLRKDLETLKDYNILEKRMYRWGYYLGTGVMSPLELKIALDALESLAIKQGDPRIRKITEQFKKRLRGFAALEDQQLFYPVRQQLNHAINYTDPDEMMEKGVYRQTLFHHIHILETAIIEGQIIEISRKKDLYEHKRVGIMKVYPLQLIYHNVAWYLLHEDYKNHHLVISRVNRLGNYCKIIEPSGRGINKQKQSLTKAYQLLENGWGLKLGNLEEQKQEVAGKVDLVKAKVRFFYPVSQFIEEGERRHPKQKIKRGKIDPQTHQPQYIDYSVALPLRSLDEFYFWINRYGEYVQVLAPSELVERHQRSAFTLVSRYGCNKDNIT